LIYHFNHGIRLANVNNADIEGLVFALNFVNVESDNGVGITFNQNALSKSWETGMDLEDDNNDEVKGNEISGNNTNFLGSLAPQITINGGNVNVIHDNNIIAGGYSGLAVLAPATGNQVFKNTFYGNTSVGIFGGGSNNNFHDNVAEGNGLVAAGPNGPDQFGPSFDLFDPSNNCGTNNWHNNTFFSANQSCIK
jgi:hypothetical protein